MPNIKRLLVSTTVALLPLYSHHAFADSWKLPSIIDDSNTSVRFVVDSTWHTVHGTTKEVSGIVSQTNPRDPLSVRVDISLPVKRFDTDHESRDVRMREVMAASTFPLVRFISSHLSERCAPHIVETNGKCSGVLSGTLSIRDVSKTIELPVQITKNAQEYVIEGSFSTRWADYNVEDPSILIAHLDPMVTIVYRTSLPLRR